MKAVLAVLRLWLPLWLPLCVGLAQSPFNEKPSYARNRDFDLQHLKLELAFDLPQQKLIGTATLRMAPLAGDLREIALDSGALAIDGITSAGVPRSFAPARTNCTSRSTASRRRIAAGRGGEVSRAAQARLFFIFPDQHHPNRPQQIWANGDTAGGNNRYWFPGYDFPNDKSTSEMLVTVPAGWEALSNGKLVAAQENKGAGTTTFHWSRTSRCLRTWSRWWRASSISTRRSGRSGGLLRAARAGRRYRAHVRPHDPDAGLFQRQHRALSVGQVRAGGSGHIRGGMENTSATTLGASAILDARDFDDRRIGTDSLIAHEMAHQWFGDW